MLKPGHIHVWTSLIECGALKMVPLENFDWDVINNASRLSNYCKDINRSFMPKWEDILRREGTRHFKRVPRERGQAEMSDSEVGTKI